MARHGENIRKRRDGRWEARYQDGTKSYHSVYGYTYEEAKSKRASVMMQENLSEQKQFLCQDILFGTVAQEWLILMKSDKKPSTNAEERRAAAQKTEYIESIKDVNDLVQFLFDHDVSGEDHDYEAEAAARERAKDLLGLVIK